MDQAHISLPAPRFGQHQYLRAEVACVFTHCNLHWSHTPSTLPTLRYSSLWGLRSVQPQHLLGTQTTELGMRRQEPWELPPSKEGRS